MDSAFDEVFTDLARLAATPCLVADREDAVLIIGPRAASPTRCATTTSPTSTTSLGAAALDCLLAAPTEQWAGCHLWRQAEMAATGSERATAASLAALAAWGWSKPDVAANAVRCVLTADPELPFAQDTAAIIGLGISVDQVIGWARTGEV